MQASQYPCAPMRKRMPLCAEVHLFSHRCGMALPRSSALQKGRARCPCSPFLPASGTARQRARRILRGTGASNLLRVSRRAAGIARKSPWVLRIGRINSARPRLTRRRHKPHASSFALKRQILWAGPFAGTSAGRIGAQRGGCPLARPYTYYCNLMAKPYRCQRFLRWAGSDP